MHELSIAMGIVDIAEKEVRKHEARKVDSINLEIGELAGIELQALDFAWDVAIKDTVLERAERHIDHIEGRARCSECGTEFHLGQIFDPCPKCQQHLHEVTAGRELRVKSITIS